VAEDEGSTRVGDGMFAMWVGRLAAPVDESSLRQVLRERKWAESLETAKDWSVDREERGIREIDATARGIEYNRMAELLSYVGSVSERFGLALAAGNEVAFWQHLRQFPTEQRWQQGQRELSQRAMGSLFGFYLLATGHNVAAVALRCLGLESALHSDMQKRLRTTCKPGEQVGKRHWPSLNKHWCGDLGKVARLSAHHSQLDLAEMVSTIAREPVWIKLDEIRGVDYHRGRPPSAPMDGAPMGSAWIEGDGYRQLSWDRDADDDNRAEHATALMMKVEQLLLVNLPRIRAQVDCVIEQVLSR
jgi:hypothetical protein